MTAAPNSDRLLEDLNEAQREAVTTTSGPLAIIAGAGSGKTRVISRRAAYAIETGVVAPDRILLVTFTDKPATEIMERVAALGHRGVMAKTFHAHALAQLRTFWPPRHNGAPMPRILESPLRLLYPLARRLPGGYAFTQAKDLADAIAWAKLRRIPPDRWLSEGGDRAPIPAQLFERVYSDYERAKARTGVIDFDDMLVETVRLLETDDAAAALVRSRKTWFSVDEYQDTSPIGERLLELWLGESRDLAVVGDPDQTIYTFTGATPALLLEFGSRHPGAKVVPLAENHRSSPQVLALANRLVSGGPRGELVPTQPAGPAPTIRRFTDDEEERQAIVAGIRALAGQGIELAEVAILVRVNAQLPELEQALTRAGIAFRVRGQRFFERREVKDARRLLSGLAGGGARGGGGPGDADEAGTLAPGSIGPALIGTVRKLFEQRLGLGASGDDGGGDETREREASLQLLLRIVADVVGARTGVSIADVLAELDRRESEEASGSADGVNLLTYHRAKGLEWDAVFLPALEEGLLPIRQAKEDAAIDEERRLLYVGITRARRHLALSWAARRTATAGGKEGVRKPSRFLDLLEPPRLGGRTLARPASSGGLPRRIAALEPRDGDPGTDVDSGILEALQRWRRDRARADAVPAYVVAHDATLFAIAEARPTSLTALARVKGMGPMKVERYGPDLMEILTGGEPGHPVTA
ncbi:MAG TPA: UvrD-helicase domain-containing protein [Candidatus Limnocylindria bacterium]|nr:UvrD-helicase domain-containing protein [Candidatus Limnocylindria bacterium]